MTTAAIIFSLLLMPCAGARVEPAATGAAAVPDDEAELKTLGAALEKLLASDTEDSAWFLERYAPSVRERLTDERILRILGMFRRDLPDAKVRAVRVKDDHEGEVVLLSAASGLAAVFGVSLEPEAPHRILGLGARLEEGDPIVEGLVDGMSSADMVRVIDALVSDLAEQDRFSGVVLLAKDGEPVFEKAWGFASRRFDVPNRVDTRFNLGSMNKMFTAVAICQLAEAGKLALDELPVSGLFVSELFFELSASDEEVLLCVLPPEFLLSFFPLSA